ncbi:MAG: hypothetical protein ACLP0B_08900 [Steroidobacteraceae bacterium]
MIRAEELDIVIRHKDGKIVAGIPQLGLFATADDVNTALAELEKKKKTFIEDLDEAGELDAIEIADRPVIAHRQAPMTSAGNLGQFAIKTGIVVTMVVGAFVITGALIGSKVEHAINHTVDNIKGIKIGGAQFWGRVEQQLDRMASSDLPEAKKQKLLADIHAIAVKWRPFIVEVQSALSGPPNQTPPTTTPTNR